MTRMLASVASIGEAQIVLEAGADIIDLKDPAAGVLGALPIDIVSRVVGLVGGQRRVSATVGDLPMDAAILSQAVRDTAATWVDFVKVGFFPAPNARACIYELALVASGACLIGVLFADLAPDFALLEDFAQAGFTGVMLDTANKAGGGLRGHMDDARLAEFVARAQALGLFTGLAGSLRLEDVPALTRLEPDYLGFRGALCGGLDRKGAVTFAQVARLREAVASRHAA